MPVAAGLEAEVAAAQRCSWEALRIARDEARDHERGRGVVTRQARRVRARAVSLRASRPDWARPHSTSTMVAGVPPSARPCGGRGSRAARAKSRVDHGSAEPGDRSRTGWRGGPAVSWAACVTLANRVRLAGDLWRRTRRRRQAAARSAIPMCRSRRAVRRSGDGSRRSAAAKEVVAGSVGDAAAGRRAPRPGVAPVSASGWAATRSGEVPRRRRSIRPELEYRQLLQPKYLARALSRLACRPEQTGPPKSRPRRRIRTMISVRRRAGGNVRPAVRSPPGPENPEMKAPDGDRRSVARPWRPSANAGAGQVDSPSRPAP